MNPKKLDYFRKKLMDARNKILNSGVFQDHEDLHIATEDLSDEADLASSTINQQVSLSIRERELQKLRLIDAALARVEDGSFGVCLESGDQIEEKRLENQPWAEYCLEVAEEREREDRQHYQRRA